MVNLFNMTKLSVNINKIATLRNARGGDIPNVVKVALDCEKFGAQGITVHPRPDERHIRYQDVHDLKNHITTEFNIEGNPITKFMDLVLETKPTQVTLVPDSLSQITSNSGWDTIKNESFLTEIITELKNKGIRSSIFIETNFKMIENASKIGADRIELYTEPYATNYKENNKLAIDSFIKAAEFAKKCGLGVNAGHDLNLENLAFFSKMIPSLDEVSIGHALISDALYLGLEKTINAYKNCLNK